MIDSHTVVRNFWDMFIVDVLIGNTDRHNGNWGFLENKISRNVSIAPIYDCGSCLNPMLEDNQIDALDEKEIKNLAINCYSCFTIDGKKINKTRPIMTQTSSIKTSLLFLISSTTSLNNSRIKHFQMIRQILDTPLKNFFTSNIVYICYNFANIIMHFSVV
jgi:hypothetical protein